MPKDYKIYVPEIDKFINARDVVIDETSYLKTRPSDYTKTFDLIPRIFDWLNNLNTDKERLDELKLLGREKLDELRLPGREKPDELRLLGREKPDKMRLPGREKPDKKRDPDQWSDEMNEMNDTKNLKRKSLNEANSNDLNLTTEKGEKRKLNEKQFETDNRSRKSHRLGNKPHFSYNDNDDIYDNKTR